ncbi:hypothetical protein PG991_003518 [Apiospora marii]|uniref:Uncharacterized protein n=1 Tax=Apiospora marii TaxID=335849 RepID=A0ABR1S3N6_9PEZI
MATWFVNYPATQQSPGASESWAARERTLPTLPSFPSHNNNSGNPAGHAYSTSDKFSGYGQSRQAHVQDLRDWLRDASNSKTPLSARSVTAGNRIICMDLLSDHVTCLHVVLGEADQIPDPQVQAIRRTRYVLAPYQDGNIIVNVVYDRRLERIYTFDGVDAGREDRHAGAVGALRDLFAKSGLGRVPMQNGGRSWKSMPMEPGLARFSRYLALEGARVFLRETQANLGRWEDWTCSKAYEGVDGPNEEDARRVWLGRLRLELGRRG